MAQIPEATKAYSQDIWSSVQRDPDSEKVINSGILLSQSERWEYHRRRRA